MRNSHLAAGVELLARVDAATICSSLAVIVGGATRLDVHLFAYLSSMANSQSGASPSAWGYQFAASSNGLPFAEALDFAMDEMLQALEIEDLREGMRLDPDFQTTFDTISSGDAFKARIHLVEEVCDLAVFRSLPGIGRATRNEPQLRRSAELSSVRLIDDAELSAYLMRMMLKVRDQLPEQFPASSPAMLWLQEWESQNAS